MGDADNTSLERSAIQQELANVKTTHQLVNLCRKLRRIANTGCVTLDTSTYQNAYSLHLFTYLQYCGYDPLDYIKKCLSSLQPYMLENRPDQKFSKPVVCVLDNLYRLSLYIKVDTTQYAEITVSFHENIVRGHAKSNTVKLHNNHSRVPVFYSNITSYSTENPNHVVADIIVMRGVQAFPITLAGVRDDDVVYVRSQDVETYLLDYCNTYLEDLYTSGINMELPNIKLFSSLQQISFTSCGNDIVSNISLLTDNIVVQSDPISRRVADSALMTYAQHVQLSETAMGSVMEVLRQKYEPYTNQGVRSLIDRVYDILSSRLLPEPTEVTTNRDIVCNLLSTVGQEDLTDDFMILLPDGDYTEASMLPLVNAYLTIKNLPTI